MCEEADGARAAPGKQQLTINLLRGWAGWIDSAAVETQADEGAGGLGW